MLLKIKIWGAFRSYFKFQEKYWKGHLPKEIDGIGLVVELNIKLVLCFCDLSERKYTTATNVA